MSATATVPSDEQLKEYAAQLPDLYKDILAAFQYADPSRRPGDGLFEGTLRNFVWNEAVLDRMGGRPSPLKWLEITPSMAAKIPAYRQYQISQAFRQYDESVFSAAIDRLIESEFIKPRTADDADVLIPTPVGERLIEVIAGKPVSLAKVPDLPKPTWR